MLSTSQNLKQHHCQGKDGTACLPRPFQHGEATCHLREPCGVLHLQAHNQSMLLPSKPQHIAHKLHLYALQPNHSTEPEYFVLANQEAAIFFCFLFVCFKKPHSFYCAPWQVKNSKHKRIEVSMVWQPHFLGWLCLLEASRGLAPLRESFRIPQQQGKKPCHFEILAFWAMLPV